MKTRRKKQTKRVLASALAAVVAASAVPVSNSVVHAEESQDRSELKLRYTSAAPESESRMKENPKRTTRNCAEKCSLRKRTSYLPTTLHAMWHNNTVDATPK